MTEDSQKDKRIQKTLMALREAFFELVLTYSYDEITVSDIIQKAQVGRSTFYQYYKSKDELLACSMSKLLDDLACSVDRDDNVASLIWLMEHFWENRKFAPRVFSGTSRKVVVRALEERIEIKLKSRCKKELVKPDVPVKLLAHQIAEAQLIITIDWLLGVDKCDITALATHIERTAKAICGIYFTSH